MPHIHDLIDFTVGAFIVHDGRVLLVHHRQLNCWLMPGGHVELDEDTDEALFREIREETGLEGGQLEIISEKNPQFRDAKALYPPRWMNIHRINERHRHLDLSYVFRAKTDTVRLADGEHYEIRWFLPAELDRPEFAVPENVRWCGKEAVQLAAQ